MITEPPTSFIQELCSATGRGVRVIALDSGVQTAHPALAGAPIRCWRVEPGEGGNCRIVDDAEGDLFGHGTAAAAIVRRYAPDAVIDSLRVIGRPGGWSQFVLAGLHWAIDQGYDVINCSFTTADTEFLPDYKTAVDRAFCRNALIVSACTNKAFWRVEYPGSFPTVISSDYGMFDRLTVRRRPGELVEFVAPGQDLLVAWKGGTWRVMTGSSFAAPHLSAIAARIRQCRPQWNACQVKSALYELAAVEATLSPSDARGVAASPA
jgi:subtilisin